jgi:hypothetical protein
LNSFILHCNAPKSAWLLDSGANKHFTFSQDKFIEYNTWPPSRYKHLETANLSTKVVSNGSIAINVPNSDGSFCVVTIPGVCHIPDLKVNLLLLGCFLCDGMSVSGSEDQMDLQRNGKTHLMFYPTKPGSTIFSINSEALPLDVALATLTPKEIDYNTMHCCFAHPSHDVLNHARKHTANFLSMHNHKSDDICAGCAQGKLPNWCYPKNKKQASVPFKIIHSNLKSYPINRFQNNKYIITFFDDHTSHAWVKLLKSKDKAIVATCQLLKMVQTRKS